MSPRAAALAALLASVDPLFITYGGFFTSEIPATALLLTSLWLGYDASMSEGRRAIGLLVASGLLGGAAVVVRPQLILTLAVLVCALRPWRVHRLAIAAFICVVATPVAGGVAYSTAASGHLTAIADNGGLNFFVTRCPVRELRLIIPPHQLYVFGNPVAVTLNRGTDYFYRGIGPWDQSFFYNQGLHCLTHDIPAQIGEAFREVADLTATSIPWPQVNEIGLSRISDITNILYCSALIIAILVLIRQRRSLGTDRSATASTGMTSRTAKILLWQLATVVPVVIVYGSEPRYRIPYDALGLILTAALATRRSDQVGKPEP